MRVATERRTLISPSEESEPFAAIPMIARDQVLGVLMVGPVGVEKIDSARQSNLETIAGQAALAIEVARLAEQNERLIPIDPLTGLFKKSAFLEAAEREFRRSWRFGQPLSILMLRVDGADPAHARSDDDYWEQLLRQVAHLVRSSVRAVDLVSHYDANILAIILIMSNQSSARGAAERLCTRISSMKLVDEHGPVLITASIGGASYPRDGCPAVFDLLDLAVSSLETAQSSGTNQVLFA
jgi:diguanylate cyclase (GGDEF)-like protein